MPPSHTTTNPDLTIYIHRKDGLGARLITLLNALRIARALGAKFEFNWPLMPLNHYEDNQSIDVVLRPDFFERHHVEETEVDGRLRDYILGQEMVDGISIVTLDREKLLAAGDQRLHSTNPTTLCLLEGESLEEVRLELRRLFLEEVMSQELVQFCEEEVFPQGELPMGMHIRVGDVANRAYSRLQWFERKYYPLKFYRPVLNQQEGILVVCSSRKMLQNLQKEYGTRLPPISGMSEQEQAVMEMVALSACQVMYGPRESAFLNFAWMISKASKRHLANSMPQEEFFDLLNEFHNNERVRLALEMAEYFYYDLIERHLNAAEQEGKGDEGSGLLQEELVSFFLKLRQHLHIVGVKRDCSRAVYERVRTFLHRVARAMLQNRSHLEPLGEIANWFIFNHVNQVITQLANEPNPPPNLPYAQQLLRESRVLIREANHASAPQAADTTKEPSEWDKRVGREGFEPSKA